MITFILWSLGRGLELVFMITSILWGLVSMITFILWGLSGGLGPCVDDVPFLPYS
jgi:hypothetical protein